MTIAILVQPYELEAARSFVNTAVTRTEHTLLIYLDLTSTGWKWSGYDLVISMAKTRKHLPIIPFPIFATFPLDESLILANYPEFFI